MLTFAPMDQNAARLIDLLGGTAKVAKLCEVNSQAVSQWRKKGIPRARLMFLGAVRPDVVGQATKLSHDSTAQDRAA